MTAYVFNIVFPNMTMLWKHSAKHSSLHNPYTTIFETCAEAQLSAKDHMTSLWMDDLYTLAADDNLSSARQWVADLITTHLRETSRYGRLPRLRKETFDIVQYSYGYAILKNNIILNCEK